MAGVDVERFRELLLVHRQSAEHAYRVVHDGNSMSLKDETEEESFDNHLADVATATYMRELDYTLEDSGTPELTDTGRVNKLGPV